MILLRFYVLSGPSTDFESTIRSTRFLRMGMEVDAKQAKINKHHNSRSTVTNGSIRDWN